MNLRPSGYEPDELPGCSTPQNNDAGDGWGSQSWRGRFLGFQESGQLFDAEVGQDASVDIEDRGFGLARNFLHFVEVCCVGADFPTFVFYTEFMEFRFCVFAPRAPLFDVKDGGHDQIKLEPIRLMISFGRWRL